MVQAPRSIEPTHDAPDRAGSPPRPVERLRERHRADVRRAILDATQALLMERGYDGLSMRRLAERCGYTAPTIYHHFGDKNGLIDTLLEERFARLVETLRAQPACPDAVERLRRGFLVFVTFGLANAEHYFLLTTARDAERDPTPSAETARMLLEEPVHSLEREGRLRVPAETAKQTFWALLHGLISLQWSRPDHEWCDALAESAVDSILRGVVCNERPATENLP